MEGVAYVLPSGNRQLGSLEDAAFTKARERLKELVNRPDVWAELTARQASLYDAALDGAMPRLTVRK
jgi:hypothetical protein